MKKVLKIMFYISFVIYCLVLLKILFGGYRNYMLAFDYRSNFVPFETIFTYIKAIANDTMNLDIPVKNLGGNLILFLPMAIYLPCMIKKCHNWKINMVTIFMLIVAVEVIQFVTRRGSFDIDDLILNMSGAFIGFGIWKSKPVNKLYKWIF